MCVADFMQFYVTLFFISSFLLLDINCLATQQYIYKPKNRHLDVSRFCFFKMKVPRSLKYIYKYIYLTLFVRYISKSETARS